MSEVIASFSLVFADVDPVSSNHIYTTGHMGRRVLTKAGLHFKTALSAAVTAELPLDWGKVVDAAHTLPAYIKLELAFGVPRERFYNKSWKPGERVRSKDGKESGRSSPYQKKDSTSYVKLTQDAIAAATCIDDHFELHQELSRFPHDHWCVVIRYQVIRDESYGY